MKTITDHQIDKNHKKVMKRANRTLKKAKAVLAKCDHNADPDRVWRKLSTPALIPVTEEQRRTAEEILRRAMGLDRAKSLKKDNL